MSPRNSLQISLLMAFGVCLIIVFLVQLATRIQIELPEHREQEYLSDVHAARQAMNAVASTIESQEQLIVDWAHWMAACEFMAVAEGSESYRSFVAREFEHLESTFEVNNIHGMIYVGPDGEVHFESSFDTSTLDRRGALNIPLSHFMHAPLPEIDSTAGGIIGTYLGPVVFAVGQVTDDEGLLEPRGHLVNWRLFDQGMVDDISAQLSINLSITPAADESLIEKISAMESGVFPRDETGRIHWLIDDSQGDPLLLVSQGTPPRTFSENIVSTSSIVGFTASALLLTA